MHRPVRHRHAGRDADGVMSGSPLYYALRPIGVDDLARLRQQAYESGRLIERDGLMILGFGEALVVELPGGLASLEGSGRR